MYMEDRSESPSRDSPAQRSVKFERTPGGSRRYNRKYSFQRSSENLVAGLKSGFKSIMRAVTPPPFRPLVESPGRPGDIYKRPRDLYPDLSQPEHPEDTPLLDMGAAPAAQASSDTEAAAQPPLPAKHRRTESASGAIPKHRTYSFVDPNQKEADVSKTEIKKV